MKKRFIKTPLIGVQVHGAKDVGTRTVNLLMGEHAGEYVRGDIMDANAVIQAFDELKGNVDNNHDSLEEIVDELHNLRDATDQSFEVFQEKAEEETANRIQGDNTLQQNIDTEKQERINADTKLNNDLTAETNRAKDQEAYLQGLVNAKADTTALTALEGKVTANTAAIDTKQPKGNYLTEHQSLEEYAKKTEIPTVPTKVSQLTNDSNFITATDVSQQYVTLEQATEILSAKQDKIVPGNVDISDIELVQDIDGLKNIVHQLANALKESGLIKQNLFN